VKYTLFAFLLLFASYGAKAQLVINEASNRNYTQVYDDTGEAHDWFELYNPGPADIKLTGWSISDNKDLPGKWTFPYYTLNAGEYLLVFASGLDIKEAVLVNHWESAILPSDSFSYIEPAADTLSGWNTPEYDASSWGTGRAGFGFGDGDDNTLTDPSSIVVYARRYFDIQDTSLIAGAVLHVDYDDGFVAYLNGVEIARAGINGVPSWNSFSDLEHEALMYQGRDPVRFDLDMSLVRDNWKQGENLFAIEVHNIRLSSTDITLIPFLSFGLRTSASQFQPLPAWFLDNAGKFMHTNFKIDPDSETLYLSTPAGILIDSLAIPRIPLNTSFGKIKDDSVATGIFLTATPGKSNNSSQAYTNGSEPAPRFSPEAGFYSSSVSITISSPSPTSVIRYTVDGSEPTPSSFLYQGKPITISATRLFKAKCFSTADKMPGPAAASTYFINVSHVVPVISISTDNSNLYGSTGIFDNYDQDWNKPCYIEYFDESKKLIFKQDAGIQIDGGAGGSRWQAQHSFRLEPGNGTFGDGDVKYVLLPDRPNRNDYSSLYLRNGSNQYNTLQYKDGLQVKAIAKNTFTYYSAHSAIVAYINGAYSGLYELREKLNADFLSENYLMNNDSLDLLTLSYYKGQVLEAIEGSVDGFWNDYSLFLSLSPTDANYLSKVGKFLDLDNYTDYIIAQAWIGNTDWPYNNIRVWRNSSTGFRWQFAVQDVEWSMLPNGWTTATDDMIGYMLGQGTSYPYIGYWLRLMQNSAYRTSFINRFADLMNTNYLFSNTGPMEEEKYSYQFPEMPAEFAKWGNSTIGAYTNNHNILRNQLEIRSGYVRADILANFSLTRQVDVTLDVQPEGAGQIKISTIVPLNYPWQGIYFSNNPVKVTAMANPGYKFTGWSNNSLISKPGLPGFTATFTVPTASFTANFEVSNENFQGVTISEIHYKNGINENSTDWIELFNGAASPVSLNGWYFTDSDTAHIFRFGTTASIDANSRLVLANNVGDFRVRYPNVTNYYPAPFNFKLGTPLDAVRLYDSSGSLLAEVNYSDIFPWPLSGDDSGRTLELRNPAGNLNDPSNWFAGCIGGSPGSSFSPCNAIDDFVPIRRMDGSLSAYPNPATEYINITISLQNGCKNATLKLYNMMGTEVKVMNIGYLEKGTSTLSMDLTGVPSGLLVIVFQAEGGAESIRIIHRE
jgi:hypothetical protein